MQTATKPNFNTAERIAEINERLLKLDEKLLTPERTVQDLIEHMLLLKELETL